ncbi:MAG TPA: Spo0E family sporulation regulatory protein-aspartic acid phosphatase [Clostridiales bacterium]|nr:Spo0E family sporulation regulatory protein-aspartic acid phosphatase [Clostridiales bacterium]
MKKFAEQIDVLRMKLNELIRNNADYMEIYKVSVELDELIAQFYDRQAQEKEAC